MTDPKFIVIDLFCGAGGTTLGYQKSFTKKGDRRALVIACVNHDKNAIQSHAANYSRIAHFTEDIRKLDVSRLKVIADKFRAKYPSAKLVLWASLECTNFSKAKGGKAKNADSRTLAWELYRYIEVLCPDLIKIENVTEFKLWGPIDKDGQPIKELNGTLFNEWCKKIDAYGYRNEWTELNAADYGAYTSRNRLFGCFAKTDIPIIFPKPTHSKKSLEGRKPWKPVKNVLELADIGESIFSKRVQADGRIVNRIKSEKTYIRVLEGLKKHALKDQQFLMMYYSTGGNTAPIIGPCPTVPTKDRFSLCTAQFMVLQYGSGKQHETLELPTGSLLGTPKQSLCSVQFILNPQWGLMCTHAIDRPAPTLIARMDKTPIALVSVETGLGHLRVEEDDSPARKELKRFMIKNMIKDVFMRGLYIDELKRIQGFPDGYVLKGTQAEQKKYIGNAVHNKVVTAWVNEYSKHF